jgi:hypothetical protein
MESAEYSPYNRGIASCMDGEMLSRVGRGNAVGRLLVGMDVQTVVYKAE